MVTRTRTRPAVALDERIVVALERHGPQDPMSLLRRVEGSAGDVVTAVVAMVVARRLRVDPNGRFALPAEADR